MQRERKKMISHLKEFVSVKLSILKNENFQKLLFVKFNICHRFAQKTNYVGTQLDFEEVEKTVDTTNCILINQLRKKVKSQIMCSKISDGLKFQAYNVQHQKRSDDKLKNQIKYCQKSLIYLENQTYVIKNLKTLN